MVFFIYCRRCWLSEFNCLIWCLFKVIWRTQILSVHSVFARTKHRTAMGERKRSIGKWVWSWWWNALVPLTTLIRFDEVNSFLIFRWILQILCLIESQKINRNDSKELAKNHDFQILNFPTDVNISCINIWNVSNTRGSVTFNSLKRLQFCCWAPGFWWKVFRKKQSIVSFFDANDDDEKSHHQFHLPQFIQTKTDSIIAFHRCIRYVPRRNSPWQNLI